MQKWSKMPRVLKKPQLWVTKSVVGLGFLAVFAYSVYTFVSFQQQALHVTGTVVRLEHESHATGRRGGHVTVERPQVTFVDPASGRAVTATAKIMSSQHFAVGDSVPLEFQPSDPAATVRVASGLSLLEIAFGVVGLTLLAFGIGSRWRYARELGLARKVAEGGGGDRRVLS